MGRVLPSHQTYSHVHSLNKQHVHSVVKNISWFKKFQSG